MILIAFLAPILGALGGVLGSVGTAAGAAAGGAASALGAAGTAIGSGLAGAATGVAQTVPAAAQAAAPAAGAAAQGAATVAPAAAAAAPTGVSSALGAVAKPVSQAAAPISQAVSSGGPTLTNLPAQGIFSQGSVVARAPMNPKVPPTGGIGVPQSASPDFVPSVDVYSGPTGSITQQAPGRFAKVSSALDKISEISPEQRQALMQQLGGGGRQGDRETTRFPQIAPIYTPSHPSPTRVQGPIEANLALRALLFGGSR